MRFSFVSFDISSSSSSSSSSCRRRRRRCRRRRRSFVRSSNIVENRGKIVETIVGKPYNYKDRSLPTKSWA